MHSQLNAPVSQFKANQKNTPIYTLFECLNQDLDFQAMQSIMDQHNLMFDGVNIDGIFNTDNPLAFTTGMKNNPDILSQGQLSKATDHEKFIALQLHKIQGLVHANVLLNV